jgi:hypothetical protein
MTLPIPSNVFADGELVTEASLYARVFTPINTIYAQLQDIALATFAGTPLKGSYDSTRPILHSFAHLTGTSDASGFVASGVVTPGGTTAVLTVTISPMIGNAGSWIGYRGDISTLTLSRFQTRNMDTTGAAGASKAYDFTADIAYQA